MTVCVAALSSDGECTICVADKALSYGDYIQWDSDTTKILRLPYPSAVLMVSGGENSSRVIARLMAHKDLGKDVKATIQIIESDYQECYEEMLEIKFIKQNGLSKEAYISAVSGASVNRHIERIARKINKFNLDVDLMVCGYDESARPFIIAVTSPGQAVDVTREGFHAIGSGFDHSIQRLLWIEHKRTHGVLETVYNCFDAKAHAEMAVGVGYEWDGYLVCSAGATALNKEMKPLIDRVWAKFDRTPFYKRSEDDLPNPPANWRAKLNDMIAKDLEKLGIPVPGSDQGGK